MKTVKCCPKNSGCQLWQVLCDGNPCVVDREIKANADVMPLNAGFIKKSRIFMRNAV
jgi:hypothetical protein